MVEFFLNAIDSIERHRQTDMNSIKEGILQCGNQSIRYVESGRGNDCCRFSGWWILRRVTILRSGLAAHHRVLVLDASGVSKAERQEFATNLPLALAKIGVETFSVLGVAQGVTSALAQADLCSITNKRPYPCFPSACLGAGPRAERQAERDHSTDVGSGWYPRSIRDTRGWPFMPRADSCVLFTSGI